MVFHDEPLCLPDLQHVTQISKLTLRTDIEQESSIYLEIPLHGLLRLQALSLQQLAPVQDLSLPALTSFLFLTESNTSLPNLSDCPAVEHIHVLIRGVELEVSRASLPCFSCAEPLYLQHTVRERGCLVLHKDLRAQRLAVDDAHLQPCEGLHIVPSSKKWPSS